MRQDYITPIELVIRDLIWLFSSSCYIHGICDTNNNNIFIDIITNKDIDSEIYVKLICGYFAPSNVHIKQIPRIITDN